MRKFLSEIACLFFAGLLYGIVIAYSVHHSKEVVDDGHPLPLADATVWGVAMGVCAIVTGLLSRVFPVGPVGRVFFGMLVGAFVMSVSFGTSPPNHEAAGLGGLGAGLGLFVGLLESARQQRAGKGPSQS